MNKLIERSIIIVAALLAFGIAKAQTTITASPVSMQDPGGYTFNFNHVPNDAGVDLEIYVSPANGSMYARVGADYFVAPIYTYCHFGQAWGDCFAALQGKPIPVKNSASGQTGTLTVTIIDQFERCTQSGRVNVCAYLATLSSAVLTLN